MVTVHNKGQRLIQIKEGNIAPNDYLQLDEESAKKLKRLFGKEITIIEDMQKDAEKAAKKALSKKEAKVTKKEKEAKADK